MKSIFFAQKLSYDSVDRGILQEVDFHISSGQLLQVVGDNGVGKTTLLKILAGALKPQSGNIVWKMGNTLLNRFNQICFIGHKSLLLDHLTVKESLDRIIFSFPCSIPIKHKLILKKLGLESEEKKIVNQLSFGQIRRLNLAHLLLMGKRIWILDEPFTHLDKLGVEIVKQLINDHLSNDGLAIISGHEAFALECDNTIIQL